MAALRANALDFERVYTNEEFEALPSEYENYELINGRLIERMASGDSHGRIATRLDHAIAFFDPDEKLGFAWRDTTFRIASGFEPKPDLAFVVAARIPPESAGVLAIRPDLAVEIHSPSDLASKPQRFAAANKIAEYLKNGVRLVWAINPQKQSVEVYHPDQREPVQILDINGELDGEDVIPGFKLKIADLFK